MHKVFAAALELQTALKESGLPFCFIGGLVLQRWGIPRMTLDADAVLVSAFLYEDELIAKFFARFESRRADGQAFAQRNRVMLLQAANGVGLDVSLGAFDFERRAAERAVDWKLEKGESLRICTADDLIVFKAFAARDQDWVDVRNVLMRQGKNLHVEQILRELGPLVAMKEDESIIPKLKKMMKEAGL